MESGTRRAESHLNMISKQYYAGSAKEVLVTFDKNASAEADDRHDENLQTDLEILSAAIIFTTAEHLNFGFIENIHDWFHRHKNLSYYLVLAAGCSLVIGGAVLTAFTGPVGLILTAVGTVLVAQVAPAIHHRNRRYYMAVDGLDTGGRLSVKNHNDQKYKISYYTGDANGNKAGYIEFPEGGVKEPTLDGESWGGILNDGRKQSKDKRMHIIQISKACGTHKITVSPDKILISVDR